MYNVTITTTGIFDEIRPSLFPLVEGKEELTFMNALVYRVNHEPSFEEVDVITGNNPEFALERERIRAFVAALCEAYGKPYGELRDEFVEALPELCYMVPIRDKPCFQQVEMGIIKCFPCIKAIGGVAYYFKMDMHPTRLRSIFVTICYAILS